MRKNKEQDNKERTLKGQTHSQTQNNEKKNKYRNRERLKPTGKSYMGKFKLRKAGYEMSQLSPGIYKK